jgi:hypothetical protein
MIQYLKKRGDHMDTHNFLIWLMRDKKMSERAAKDVLSRCGRVCRILNIDQLDDMTLLELQETREFQKSSAFVKPQLKRAVTLHLEFMNKHE